MVRTAGSVLNKPAGSGLSIIVFQFAPMVVDSFLEKRPSSPFLL